MFFGFVRDSTQVSDYKQSFLSELEILRLEVEDSLQQLLAQKPLHFCEQLIPRSAYPARGEVPGLSPQFIDLRFCNVSTFLGLLQLMLGFPEFGEMNIGLFILN